MRDNLVDAEVIVDIRPRYTEEFMARIDYAAANLGAVPAVIVIVVPPA